jgi:glycosyltransferase 2 family protein
MKIPWRGAIGLALTVGFLWWAFKDVQWAELWKDIQSANPLLVAAAIVVGTAIFPLRALRWRYILEPVESNVAFGKLWRATAIGVMANNVFPTGRMGELLRPLALSRETTVPFSSAFASLVVDRLFDAVVILLLGVAALLDPRFPGGVSGATIAAATAFVLALGVGVYGVVFFPELIIRIFEAFARRVAPRFEERGRALLRSFVDGLSVLRHPARFALVFFWTLVHWMTAILSFWIMFRAIGIDVPFSAAVLVQVLIVFGVAAPSTPGFFGVFETFAILGLGFYGVERNLAAAWALSYHVLSLIPITLIGAIYLVRSGVRLGDLKQVRQ